MKDSGIILTAATCWEGKFLECPSNLTARGGYGTVYKGLCDETQEVCAIKEMALDDIFEREVSAMTLMPEHVCPDISAASE